MTTSTWTPRRASSGSTSAALPSSPIESGRLLARGGVEARERVVEVGRALVQVAGLDAALDPLQVGLDAQRGAAAHRDRQRLRAAHAAEPGGHDQAAAQVAAEALAPGRREGLIRPLQDPLRADVDPRARRSSGRTSSARPRRVRGSAPSSPTRRRGSSWRSVRAAPARASANTATGLPDCTSSVWLSASACQLALDRLQAARLRAALPMPP